VTTAVTTALNTFLAPRKGIIGFDVYVNDLHHLIRQAHRDIDWVELISPTIDVFSEVVSPVPVLSAGAGTLAAGTYYYRLSAINATGETVPGPVNSFTALANTGVTLTWPTVTNATGYKIYGRSDSTGLNLLLIASVGLVNSWTDSGAATPAGALPTMDTTGVHYPSLGSVTLSTSFAARQIS